MGIWKVAHCCASWGNFCCSIHLQGISIPWPWLLRGCPATNQALSSVISFNCTTGQLASHGVRTYSCAHSCASLTALTLSTTPCVCPPLMIGTQASWRRSKGIRDSYSARMSRNSCVHWLAGLLDVWSFSTRQLSWYHRLQRRQRCMGSSTSGLYGCWQKHVLVSTTMG